MSGTIGVERIFPLNMPGLKRLKLTKVLKLNNPEYIILEN